MEVFLKFRIEEFEAEKTRSRVVIFEKGVINIFEGLKEVTQYLIVTRNFGK